MFRQRSSIGLVRTWFAADLSVICLDFGMHGFLSGLDILRGEPILFWTGLLGSRTEHGALVIRNQLFQLENAGLLAVDHSRLNSIMLLLRTNDGLQSIDIVRKIGRRIHGVDLPNPGI